MYAKPAKTPYGESTTLYSTQSGPLYSNGNKYEIRLKIVGSNRQLKVLMKNITTGSQNERTFWVPTAWSNHDDAFYFKAGLYHLNNSGNSNDYAQVTFYALEKSHTTN